MASKLSNKMKSIIVVIAALLFAVVMLGVYYLFIVPPQGKIESSGSKQNVTLILEYKSQTFEYKFDTDAATVYDLLIEQDEKCELDFAFEESEYGAFVTGFKGRMSTDSVNYMFYINGEMAQNGVSTQTIKSNDTIKFTYCSTVWSDSYELIDLSVKGGMFAHQKILIVFLSLVGAVLVAAIVITTLYLVKRQKNSKTVVIESDEKNDNK